MSDEERNCSDGDGVDSSDDDCNFEVASNKRKKIDVMGQVAECSDRLALSVRQRTMYAASVANSLGVSVERTNISVTSAWRTERQKRKEKASLVRQLFVAPKECVLHWDGKRIKVKRGEVSERCVVFISATDGSGFKKLLGAPEVVDGTAASEAFAVIELLTKWGINEEVKGVVFDTTSSNSGWKTGTCMRVEQSLEKPVLWLACRHHIHELHIKHVVGKVTGNTKDPGVALFRRLKKDWNSLQVDKINPSSLVKLDLSDAEPWLLEHAHSVLTWANEHNATDTWPRSDYKELLQLSIMYLGGHIEHFKFRYPGPDHHARWMSKAIYYLKLALLSEYFHLVEKELKDVKVIAEFVALFYAPSFLQSQLGSAAPFNDLELIRNMTKYSQKQPDVATTTLQSCHRHLWYLTSQAVVLALADKRVPGEIKKKMAAKLYNTPRENIGCGRPKFPDVDKIKDLELDDLISSKSWLLFDLLGLFGPQDWLITSPETWHEIPSYQALEGFAANVTVVNDVAERGVKLITDFIEKCEDEGQREALLQVVEDHRNTYPDYKKSTLSLL